MINNKDIYKRGGGGGMGSFILPIYKKDDKWTTDADWHNLFKSYRNAESLFLSVLKSDSSYTVLDIDTINRTDSGLVLTAKDSQENLLYNIIAPYKGQIEITVTPGGGGIAGDITYEEI